MSNMLSDTFATNLEVLVFSVLIHGSYMNQWPFHWRTPVSVRCLQILNIKGLVRISVVSSSCLVSYLCAAKCLERLACMCGVHGHICTHSVTRGTEVLVLTTPPTQTFLLLNPVFIVCIVLTALSHYCWPYSSINLFLWLLQPIFSWFASYSCG